MRYVIEDTATGFKLSIENEAGKPISHINEYGGHGALEQHYAKTAMLWGELRQQERINQAR